MNENLLDLGRRAKKAAFELSQLSTDMKNKVLASAAVAIEEHIDEILEANVLDLENAKRNNMSEALLDRLKLDKKRIENMALEMRKVISLEDPIGEFLSTEKLKNDLIVAKKVVPIGVIGIIYESRPNVTTDAFALCLKSSNAVILKGGSDAINTNKAIVKIIRQSIDSSVITEDVISLIESTDREVTKEFMRMNEYVDLLIPRGSASLIKATLENSTIPVIETGTGNCHVYVDKDADFKKAIDIIINAKTQRIGVCNACESLVIHKDVLDEFMPLIAKELIAHNVKIRGDERAVFAAKAADIEIEAATEEDFYKEYLDYIISVKTVDTLEEAIAHINEHNTKHSDAIITETYATSQKFLEQIDSACVYVNASTRFTDGFEFGFGAEIGISTQKLHARGPMGLKALTSYKYIIYGDGQIRE